MLLLANLHVLCKDFTSSLLFQQSSSWAQFCSTVLLECISQEKPQVLTTYLQLEQVHICVHMQITTLTFSL